MRAREASVTRKLRIAERDIAHAELMRLSKHGIDAGVGREGDYLQLVGVATGHIERLRADRAPSIPKQQSCEACRLHSHEPYKPFQTTPYQKRKQSASAPKANEQSSRSSIQTPRKIPPGPTRAAESSPKRIASTFYAPPGPAHSRTILTKLIGTNPGQSRPSKTDPVRSKSKAPRRIAPALDARDAARA